MKKNGLSLRDLVASRDKFIIVAEYVPLPGNRLSNFEKFLTGYAQKRAQLPDDVVVAGVTIPQSPSGAAMIRPSWFSGGSQKVAGAPSSILMSSTQNPGVGLSVFMRRENEVSSSAVANSVEKRLHAPPVVDRILPGLEVRP